MCWCTWRFDLPVQLLSAQSGKPAFVCYYCHAEIMVVQVPLRRYHLNTCTDSHSSTLTCVYAHALSTSFKSLPRLFGNWLPHPGCLRGWRFTSRMRLIFMIYLYRSSLQVWRERDDTLGSWNVGTRPLELDTRDKSQMHALRRDVWDPLSALICSGRPEWFN